MKKIIFFALALCAFSIISINKVVAQDKDNREEMKPGDPLPEFTLSSSVNGNISSKDVEGNVLLITFFATWCAPCQKELAAVQKELWPKYKNEKGFKLIVVGREHTDEELTTYNETKKFSFPLYPDPKRGVYSKFADITIPRAYLFGKDGKLIHASKGYDEKEFENLMKMIEEAL